MYINPPFTEKQIKSINTYQRVEHLFTKLMCKCGGLMYADEAGLICKKCMKTCEICPAFIANNIWNKFSKKTEKIEDIEEYDGID